MMRVVFIAFFFVLALTTVYVMAAPLAEVLCLTPETSFFACQTTKKKWICLCGQFPKNLQYRFGAQGQVELRYPEEPVSGMDRFRFAHSSRFQTERSEVAFRNYEVDYFIFDYTENGEQQAGVRVFSPGKDERMYFCSGQITSRLIELKDRIHCDNDRALIGRTCP